MKNHFLLSLLALSIVACGASFEAVTSNLHTSADPSYGFSVENPIKIGHWGLEKSIHASMRFLSMLRGINGERFKVLFAATVRDPKGTTKSVFPNRFGSNISGGRLDAYTFVIEGTRDTLTLYFDSYHADSLAIPLGLTLARDLPNN